MQWDKKTIKYIFFGVLGCIAFYWLLNESEQVRMVWKFVSGMLTPFVVGAALAFVLNVPMRAIEGKLLFIKRAKLRRTLSLVLTIIAVLLVIAGVVMLLIPQIEETIQEILVKLPAFFVQLETYILDFLEQRPELMELFNKYVDLEAFDWNGIIQKVTDFLGKSISQIFNGAISMVGSLAGMIFNAVISFVFALYCLGSKENLARQGRKMLYAIAPEHFADESVRILRMTNSAFSNFITGQCLEAVILALLFVIAMMICRMPYIPLISVLIAVTALIPLVGAFVGCILGAFFILVADPMQAVYFVILFLVLQQFEGNVIYPRVVCSSIGLPGMWVLLAVTVGGELMGVGGMLVMVPFASVLYMLLREFADNRLASRNIPADKLIPQPPELQSHFKMKLEKSKKKRHAKRAEKKIKQEASEE